MIAQLLTPTHVSIRPESVRIRGGRAPLVRSVHAGAAKFGQVAFATTVFGAAHYVLWLLVARPPGRSSRATERAERVWSFHPRGHCRRWRVRRS
jgi:hypothetical protein